LATSPFTGAVVAGVGHVATALVSGMPLGLALHLLVALGMMLAAYATGVVAKLNKFAGCAAGVIINGVVLPVIFMVIPGFGWPFVIAVGPSIFVAATLNMVVALGLHNVSALKKMRHGR